MSRKINGWKEKRKGTKKRRQTEEIPVLYHSDSSGFLPFLFFFLGIFIAG
jgi:hypothetical protein